MVDAGKQSVQLKIGRFHVQSILGRGSMGKVFLAYDPQLDRDVAIKIIQMPEEMLPEMKRQRIANFQRESRMVARLQHPNIVQVYDAGEYDKQPYMVLERIEGETLESHLRRSGRLNGDFGFQVIRQLLAAVAHAHKHQIIHRDLKPSNIMIQTNGLVRVMDFGIAQVTQQTHEEISGLAGTPRYMSPEQICCRPIDTRSDVFSLGSVMYEILSGKRAFPQKTLEELRRAIVDCSAAPLATLRPDLSRELLEMASRSMAARPEHRYVDAETMLRALERCPEIRGHSRPSEGTAEGNKEIVDFILKRIERKGDFPAISKYLEAVMSVARSENSSAHSIAQSILKDFALTHRILRMVNSPYYRGGGQAITTISRAVVMLGIDTIISVAGGLSVFEHYYNRAKIEDVKAQTVHALLTALHARQAAHKLEMENIEEAFICGMFSHLGRLIVSFYFSDEYEAIVELIEQGQSEEEASANIMRLSYADLGAELARRWNMSEKLQDAIRGLDEDHVGPLRTPLEKLKGAVSFGREMGRITMLGSEEGRQAAMDVLSKRFDGMINLHPRQMERMLEASVRNAWDLSHAVRMDLKKLDITSCMMRQGEEERESMGQSLTYDASSEEEAPSVKLKDPTNETFPGTGVTGESQRQDVIMKTLMEITNTMMGPFQLNDVLMMILEGLYRGIGFSHVLLAMVNPTRDHVYCRFGLGDNIEAMRDLFHFPLSSSGRLPAQCILRGREIIIYDIEDDHYREGFSARFLEKIQPKSIVMQPIVVKDQPIGLFFVDRHRELPPLTTQNVRDMRTLCQHALLAIQQTLARARS